MLNLENDGKIFQPQTSVNASTVKSFQVKNQSGLEMQYRLTLDENIDQLNIEGNTNGTILSNDKTIVTTNFTPKEEGKYKFQIGLSQFGLSTQHYKKLN